jgi:hypothetical protein
MISSSLSKFRDHVYLPPDNRITKYPSCFLATKYFSVLAKYLSSTLSAV